MRHERWNDKYLNDPRPTDELLVLVLAKNMDADNEEYWIPVRALQYRLPSIFEEFEALLVDEKPKSRESAATILWQNSIMEKWEVTRCVHKLLFAIARETSAETLVSMLHALGNLHDRQCINAILRFAQHSGSGCAICRCSRIVWL